MPLLVALLAFATWKTYPLGGVILDLPTAPKSTGASGVSSMWVAEDEENSVSLILTSVPASVPEVTLASTVEGAANGAQAKIAAQKDLVLSGWPGLEIRLEREGYPPSWMRVYHLKDQLLTLVVSSEDPKIADRVFGSIRLAPRLGIGPQKQAGAIWKRAKLGKFSVEMPKEPLAEEGRLTGAYGSRTYTLSVSTGDPKKANEEALWAVGGKVLRADMAILVDQASEWLEGETLGGRMAFRAESIVVGERVVTLTALVPAVLKSSPETKRFFGSFRIE